MGNKTRVTITVDKELFEAFRYVLPEYVSVSGVMETFIKEFMIGHYKHGWTVGEMVDVMRGKTTVERIARERQAGERSTADEGKEAELGLRQAIREREGPSGRRGR